jgi:LPS-assembly lipoprotein
MGKRASFNHHSHPPLEGGSKFRAPREISGRGDVRTQPLPEALRASTLPQGEGGKVGAVLAIALSLFLAACGFRPLYGDGGLGANAPQLSSVYVEPVSERVGYELRNNLLDLLNSGPPQSSLYRLKLYLAEREDPVVVQTNTSITRFNYTLTAHYELMPRGDTATLKAGDITAFAAYSVAAAPFLFATASAQRDARNRAAVDIAERLRTELAVYLRETAERSASAAR